MDKRLGIKLKRFLKSKWFVVVYFVLFFGILLALLGMRNEETKQDLKTGKKYEISKDWYYEFPDGAHGYITLPGKLPGSDSDMMTIRNVIPELDTDVVFVFKARHTYVRISVDGKVLFDDIAPRKAKNRWYVLNGIEFVDVTLTPEDSGKVLTIESYCSFEKYLCEPGPVFLGNRGDFLVELVRDRMPAVFCCLLLFLVAVFIFGLWAVAIFLLRHNLPDILCLSLFTFTVALWMLTETGVSQYFGFGNISLTYLAYEMLALAPVPIALFFFYAGERKIIKDCSKIAAIVPLAYFIIINLLHFLHIVPLTTSLTATQIMLVVEVFVIAVIQMSEINYMRKKKDVYDRKLGKLPMVGICVLVPLAIMEIIKYMFFSTKLPNDGKLITIGVVVYIICIAIDNIARTTFSAVKNKNSAENKTQFLANMSHEIRTPLNAILGFNEAILQNSTDPKIRKYAMNIQESGDNLKSIINSILDITKIEMGELEICTVEYSTLQMLDNLISMIQMLADKKGLEFKVDVDEKLPEILIGDEPHLRQVLINILNNAVKYTDSGSISLKVKVVSFSIDSPIVRILFSVKDTGRGIKEEDKERLFKKFERLDAGKYDHTEGTGLGMSIVQQTLVAMGSQIQLTSEYGVGSEFFFEIEQCVVNVDCIGDFTKRRNQMAVKEYRGVTMSAPDARILIVDDVQMNIDAVIALLESTRMQIDGATSGEQALEMVKNKCYDLIFMDHMMPGMDGIEATKRIRDYAVESNDPYFVSVPIVALTANAVVGMKELYQQSGMQDIVIKPVEVSSIIRCLKNWLPKNLIMYAHDENNVFERAAINTEQDDVWDFTIDGIDIDEAKKYSVNLEGYKRNLNSFVKNHATNRAEINRFFEEKNINDYVIKVHGLKSTSKMIGAMELSEKALNLEKLGNNGELSKAGNRELLSLYDKVTKAIEDFFENKNGSQESSQEAACSIDEYNEIIARIQKAAAEYDAGELMMLEDELSKLIVPAEKKEEFEQLTMMVSNMAFGEITRFFAK